MTTIINLAPLDAAFNRQSWEWLQGEAPEIADALQVVVRGGATPDEVRRHTMRYTGRAPLAARIEQAAAHLATMRDMTK